MITVVVVVVAKNGLLQRFFVSRLGFQILNRAETRRLTRRVRRTGGFELFLAHRN